MSELLQWIGAIVCLVAFALSQRGSWRVASYRYLVCNLIGGGMLSVAAALTHQWGFVLLEGVWAGVAGWSLVVRLRAGRSAGPMIPISPVGSAGAGAGPFHDLEGEDG
ncbi:MAG: hypothetical protein WBQ18_10800 [Solirubrobacteraceae bacterium]